MDALRRAAARFPTLTGVALAGLLLAAYVVAIRPARLWTAAHVVYPLLQQVRTERAASFRLARIPGRPDAVFALPAAAAIADDALYVRTEEPPQWAAPVGVIFLLPALFLIGFFPTKPYWAYLLAYHVALGVVSLAVFAVGLAAWEPAFKVYFFSRTYLAETVSLVVPLLLALAAWGTRGAAPAATSGATAPRAPTGGTPAA